MQFTEPKRFIRRRENRLSQSFPTTNSFDNNLSLEEGKVFAIYRLLCIKLENTQVLLSIFLQLRSKLNFKQFTSDKLLHFGYSLTGEVLYVLRTRPKEAFVVLQKRKSI